MVTTDQVKLNNNTLHPAVKVLSDRCSGCQECLIRCPTEAIVLDQESWTVKAIDELCVGCRQCERTCPFSAIVIQGPAVVKSRVEVTHIRPKQLLGDKTETRKGITNWQDALQEAARCLQCPDPTCVRGCPAHNDIPGFISALLKGSLDEAAEILSRTSMMPDICSRVCDQALQCEGACSWALAGAEPVAIGALERFITDNYNVVPPRKRSSVLEGTKVAIIGSGPAGAACAWDLIEHGADVVVFEKNEVPGGLLTSGIPEFTLPKAVSSRVWKMLCDAGVTLKLNSEISYRELAKLEQEFYAVVLAVGAQSPIRLNVKGSDLSGIISSDKFIPLAQDVLDGKISKELFLSTLDIKSENKIQRVLVLGAGNTAMDVARLARRIGFEATCIDWMKREFAPVREDELNEASAEGVNIKFLRTVSEFIGDEKNHVIKAQLSQTVQVKPHELPKVVGKAEELEVDLVVLAMGFRIENELKAMFKDLPYQKYVPEQIDRVWLASGITYPKVTHWARGNNIGKLALLRESALWEASFRRQGTVFVIGDALIGPSTVVEAMAHGKKAADAILSLKRIENSRFASKDEQLKVLVGFESLTGTTETIAKEFASLALANGFDVKVAPLDQVDMRAIASCDVLIVGSWIKGFIVADVKPAPYTIKWLSWLKDIPNKSVGIFLTYEISPKGALDYMEKELASKGANVIFKRAFKSNEINFASKQLLEELTKTLKDPALALKK